MLVRWIAVGALALASAPVSRGVADTPRDPRPVPAEPEPGADAAGPKLELNDLVGAGVLAAPATTFAIGAHGSVQQRRPTVDAAGPHREPTVRGLAEDAFADVVLVGDEGAYWCSGVLIDRHRVLTAGHCAHATRIGFGNTAAVALPAPVAGSRRHPTLDVAVLTLARPAVVETHPRRTHRDGAAPLGTVRIMGFGVSDRLRLTGFGTKRRLDVGIDGWGCTNARASATGCRPGEELLVRGGQGNDTCLGDSGGPVFERGDGVWRLLAITSRGMRPRKVICGEGGIYVRLDRIHHWLEEESR